jgi:hypothetical protein
MSKVYYLVLIIILTIFTGCLKEQKIEFIELFNHVIGYDDNDEMYKPIPVDSLLMMDKSEFDKFNEDYFSSREIDFKFPKDHKAELFIQIPSDSDAVNSYRVSSIIRSNKELIVNLSKTGETEFKRAEGFKGEFKWIIIVELDKKYLIDDMKVVVNID